MTRIPTEHAAEVIAAVHRARGIPRQDGVYWPTLEAVPAHLATPTLAHRDPREDGSYDVDAEAESALIRAGETAALQRVRDARDNGNGNGNGRPSEAPDEPPRLGNGPGNGRP